MQGVGGDGVGRFGKKDAAAQQLVAIVDRTLVDVAHRQETQRMFAFDLDDARDADLVVGQDVFVGK